VNAKWFAPLFLLGFAGFVLAAKAYLASIPREVIQPPELGTAQRIYGEIPVAARRDEALSRVFRPRPRSLDPLPIMAMTRPIPEPVRPATGRTSRAVSTASSNATIGDSEVVLASPPKPTFASPSHNEPVDGADKATAATSAPVEDAAEATIAISEPEAKDEDGPTRAVAVATEAAVEAEGALKSEPATRADDNANEVASARPTDSKDPIEPIGPSPTSDAEPAAPPGWKNALLSLAEQADLAAVRLRSNYENGPAFVLDRAYDALAAGRFDAALRDFDAVLAREPGSFRAWSGRGESLVGLNRFDEAAEAYARAVAFEGAGQTERYNYGVVLYRLSRNSEAATQFREVVAKDADHAEAHYNLATLAQRDGRLAEAQAEWTAFTRLQPNVAGGWFNLGIVQMDYDRPQEAVECFKKVIALDLNDADAHINLAMALLAADQPNEALKALETAELRLPGDRVVLRYLADVHTQLAESGDPRAVMHRQQADAYRTRIAATPTRETRPVIAGTPVDSAP